MSPHGSSRFQVQPPRLNRRGHQPSFSAALLDAIYHSLEADADTRSPTGAGRTPASPAQRTPVSSSRHRPTAPALSRSSSCTSVRSPRPCRVRPDPQPSPLLLPPPPTGCRPAEKKTCRKNRKAKTKVAPFACLLNALLCNRRRSADKSVPNTPRAALEPPASARSILLSRASRRESAAATTGGILTPARRAVRFSPVAVVVDDEHGRGIGTATRLRDVEVEAERRVEELLRALGVADERERAKDSSESSSDLFELAFEDGELPRPRSAGGGPRMERPRPRV